MAGPTFACGFECGLVAAGGAPHVTNSQSASISTTTVRSGSRALRLNPSASAGFAQLGTFSSTQTCVVRSYVRFASLPTSDWLVLAFIGGGGVSAGIGYKASDSKLYPAHDSSAPAFGSTGGSVTTGQWYQLDLKVVTSANPWTVDVQVDGTTLTQYTPALSAGGGTQIILGTAFISSSFDLFFDDVCVSETAADYPLGAGYVNHFVPISDGTHNVAGAGDFKKGAGGVDITNSTTNAYLLVDDVPMDDTTPDTDDYINAIAPPNASDYVEVVFGPAPGISTPTAAPRAVECAVAYHQAAAQTGNIRLALNDNGTVDDVLNQTAAGVTTIRYARKHYATAPTGGAWTVVSGAGNFNNARMRFYSSDAAPDQYFDCAMIEAEFAQVAAPTSLPPFRNTHQPRFLTRRRVI